MKLVKSVAYIYFLGSGFFTSSVLIREALALETDTFSLAAVSLAFGISGYFVIYYVRTRK